MDTYVPWGHHTDIETILKSGHFAPIFVTGLSGNGKTTMIEQACARLKREFYRVNITAQTDEDDLLGGFRLIDGNTVWCDGPVIRAMKAGGVLLLDEIDLGGHLMMCLQPVLEGKGVYVKKINEWVQPAAGFTILATANTKGQGDDTGKFSGTGMMNEAMLDRFHFTMEQPYATASTERKILLKNMAKWNMDIAKDGDNYQFADMLTKWADTIRQTFLQGGCSEIITTRRLERIVEAFAIFGDRMKAIKMSVARFDEETQSDFTRLYEKIDVNVSIPEETTTTGPLNVENNECPY
jgi:midasin (ATPase involved in ribosome maturation)